MSTSIEEVDGLVHHFFEVNHFKDRCLKFQHKMEAIMAQ
jgi:hypothetical protein